MIADTATGQSGSTTFQVTVSDLALVLGPAISFTVAEGAAFTNQAVASFTDPGGAEPNASDGGPLSSHYSATINWGDNSPTTAGTVTFNGGTFTVIGSHSYNEEGVYPISVTLMHEQTPSIPVTGGSATVTDPAVIGAPVSVGTTAGTLFSGAVATFTDPGGVEPNDNTHYTASIDWGDNTTTTGTLSLNGGTYTVSGSHTYTTGGAFTIKTTINHEGVLTIISGLAATGNLPVATPPATQSVNEASTQFFSLGSFSDGNANSGPWTVTVAWGDGTPNTTFTVITQGTLGFQSHTFSEEGSSTVTVMVTDRLGLPGSTTFKVNVADPAVVPGSTVVFPARPGVQFINQKVATFTDPGGPEIGPIVALHYVASIDWGDRTPATSGVITLSGNLFTVTGTHTYLVPSVFLIHVTLIHENAPQAIVSALALVTGSGSAVVAPGAANRGSSPVSLPVADPIFAAAGTGFFGGFPVTSSLLALGADTGLIPMVHDSSIPVTAANNWADNSVVARVFSDEDWTALLEPEDMPEIWVKGPFCA
jgi:hypothetical protein